MRTPVAATAVGASQATDTKRQRLPTSTAEQRHTVQFYEDDSFLIDTVTDYAGSGLEVGEPLLLVATEPHRRGILERLRSSGVHVDRACATGQIVVFDAHHTLEKLMTNGVPDRERFRSIIGDVILKSASRGCHVQVRAYGEMVDLLWKAGNRRAAVQLEELWNELARTHPFTLLCSYSIRGFTRAADARPFQEICHAHSHVLPAESYSQLDSAEERLREVSRLQYQAQVLQDEIEHRRQAEEALRRAVQVREDFLSVAGHELKTPLTALALKVQRLVRDARRQPESSFTRKVGDDAEAALKQIKRLSHLVNELLDASRIAATRFVLHRDDLDLTEVVHEVVSRFDAQSAHGGSELIVESAGRVLVHADRLRMEQVITNLVDNALKYGLGKPVRVWCGRDGTTAILSVKDEGIGIDPRDQGRIFERFERAVSEHAYGGLGLGLFITRTVVEALGGTIHVRSEPGKGSTFTITLPVASPGTSP